MKLIISLLSMIFVTSAFASHHLELLCHEKGELILSANVKIEDKENFEVELLGREGKIPVTSKWLILDEEGKPESITTSGGWENFRIERVGTDLWKGEYWYDNTPFYLECSSKKSQELSLTCSSQYLRDISVHVSVTSRDKYYVKLSNFNSANWHVDREKVTFSDSGEIVSIEKAAFMEQFAIQKKDGIWTGLYAYDLGYYPLTCK